MAIPFCCSNVIEIYKYVEGRFTLHQAIDLPIFFGDLNTGPMAFFAADESYFMLLPSNSENLEGLLYEWISDKFIQSDAIPNMRFVTDVEVIEHQKELWAITVGNVYGTPCGSDNFIFKWENRTFKSILPLPSCGYSLSTAPSGDNLYLSIVSPGSSPDVKSNYILQLKKLDDLRYFIEEKYVLSTMGESYIAHDVISYNIQNRIYLLTVTGSRFSVDKQILAHQFSDAE